MSLAIVVLLNALLAAGLAAGLSVLVRAAGLGGGDPGGAGGERWTMRCEDERQLPYAA